MDPVTTPRIRSLAVVAQSTLALAADALERGDARQALAILDVAKGDVSRVIDAQEAAALTPAAVA